jgi:hypothetical protein
MTGDLRDVIRRDPVTGEIDDDRYVPRPPRPYLDQRITWWEFLAVLAVCIGVVLLMWAMVGPGYARDTTGLSEKLSPELSDWVRGLKGKHGIGCCDDSDGIDPVWDIAGDRYRVFHSGRWLVVDDDALLKMPNRLGVARAWIGGLSTGAPFVRCFLPGPVT